MEKVKKNLFRTGLIKNIFRVSQCGKQEKNEKYAKSSPLREGLGVCYFN